MYHLNITNLAEEDILRTSKYISEALKAPIAANKLLDEIEKYANIIEETPNIFPIVSDVYLAEKRIRFAIVKNYMMFYIVNENEKLVDVLRFLYGRRDWKNILMNSKS